MRTSNMGLRAILSALGNIPGGPSSEEGKPVLTVPGMGPEKGKSTTVSHGRCKCGRIISPNKLFCKMCAAEQVREEGIGNRGPFVPGSGVAPPKVPTTELKFNGIETIHLKDEIRNIVARDATIYLRLQEFMERYVPVSEWGLVRQYWSEIRTLLREEAQVVIEEAYRTGAL